MFYTYTIRPKLYLLEKLERMIWLMIWKYLKISLDTNLKIISVDQNNYITRSNMMNNYKKFEYFSTLIST